MKLLFRVTGENVSSYNRATKGYELCAVNEDYKFLYNLISEWEDLNFWEQEDGSVDDCEGNEVMNIDSPNNFDFGDYSYNICDLEDVYRDSEKLAINASPFHFPDNS